MTNKLIIKLMFLIHRLKAKGKYNIIFKLKEKYGLETKTDCHD